MALPGGPADKQGNYYELLWTVQQCLYMIRGDFDAIHIEDPAYEKSEFTLKKNNTTRLCQIKDTQKNWSLRKLHTEGILSAILTHLQHDLSAHFYFVSTAEVSDLQELSERARQSISHQNFEQYFTKAKDLAKAWQSLLQKWRISSTDAWDLLKRVYVEQISLKQIQSSNELLAQLLYQSSDTGVEAQIMEIVQRSVPQYLSRVELIAQLEARGYRQSLLKPNSVLVKTQTITQKFLRSIQLTLLAEGLTPSEEVTELLKEVQTVASAKNYLIKGGAGIGKSSALYWIAFQLQAQQIPVIALRLDRLSQIHNANELTQYFELNQPLIALIRQAADAFKRVVVIIDQLDAISIASGRQAQVRDVFEALIDDMYYSASLNIQLLIACRDFDLKHDYRLNKLLNNQKEIALKPLSLKQVKKYLHKKGLNPELFTPQQLNLLCIPQNLSLFEASEIQSQYLPTFKSTTELLAAYVDHKRHVINTAEPLLHDAWHDIIQCLCDEMSEGRCLSVPKECLDAFDERYVKRLCSEGVIVKDSDHYAFWHESFFDYCFARNFIRQKKSLVIFLLGTEQSLFRRSQTRQILTYLQGTPAFFTAVDEVLKHPQIRVHLKELVLGLLADLHHVEDELWQRVGPWLVQYAQEQVLEREACDRFSILVWSKLSNAKSWFLCMLRQTQIQQWLASPEIKTHQFAMRYLHQHARHAGDEVAILLEPFKESSDAHWCKSFAQFFTFCPMASSEALFQLFLHRFEAGLLKDASRDKDGNFWQPLHEVIAVRPKWIAELMARSLNYFKGSPQLLSQHLSSSPDSYQGFYTAAKDYPESFVEQFFPLMLELTQEHLVPDTSVLPQQDRLWSYDVNDPELNSLDGLYPKIMELALVSLYQKESTAIVPVVQRLQKDNTDLGNHLLMALYLSDIDHFAQDAVQLLLQQPWRFVCSLYGDSSSTYALGRSLLQGWSQRNLNLPWPDLVAVLLKYRHPEYDDEDAWSAFHLLSALPESYLSQEALELVREMRAKGYHPEHEPRPIKMTYVESPIPEAEFATLSNEHILAVLRRYNNVDDPPRFESSRKFKGNARQLAHVLKSRTQVEPERFATLALAFTPDILPLYTSQVLQGLVSASCDESLKRELCEKAFAERPECADDIVDVLAQCEEQYEITHKVIHYLLAEASEPSFAVSESTSPSQLIDMSLNCDKGRAVHALLKLLIKHGKAFAFQTLVQQLFYQQHPAIQYASIKVATALLWLDATIALQLFQHLQSENTAFLKCNLSFEFLDYAMRHAFLPFVKVLPFLNTLAGSTDVDARQQAVRLMVLAHFYGYPAAERLEQMLNGDEGQRLAIADSAAKYIAYPQCAAWCVEQLNILFADNSIGVRKKAARCFWYLKREKTPLKPYITLIESFINLPLFWEANQELFFLFKGSPFQLPEITLKACRKYIEHYACAERSSSQDSSMSYFEVSKLVFKFYVHYENAEAQQAECLDLIDTMLWYGFMGAEDALRKQDVSLV